MLPFSYKGGGNVATDKIQTGIRLEEEALKKIRYVAKKEKRTLNSMVEFLVECKINQFESENGSIPLED